MGKDKPRWKPSSGMTADSVTIFMGYANDLDVWLLDDKDRIIVVGPDEKRIYLDDEDFNFDAFDAVDDNLVMLDERVDLHIDVHDMCLIYALCVEHGLLKENTNEPE
jgi:hypothetical protein